MKNIVVTLDANDVRELNYPGNRITLAIFKDLIRLRAPTALNDIEEMLNREGRKGVRDIVNKLNANRSQLMEDVAELKQQSRVAANLNKIVEVKTQVEAMTELFAAHHKKRKLFGTSTGEPVTLDDLAVAKSMNFGHENQSDSFEDYGDESAMNLDDMTELKEALENLLTGMKSGYTKFLQDLRSTVVRTQEQYDVFEKLVAELNLTSSIDEALSLLSQE
ncbi:hypothetical protein EDD86DRAFT_198503 [Gorgonomyces haynaldii]|nr:hypothetical protein EDD86DRAFT_198503 [Gorgonomyces haynaldii]